MDGRRGARRQWVTVTVVMAMLFSVGAPAGAAEVDSSVSADEEA